MLFGKRQTSNDSRPITLLVGLGNPGKKYAKHRHNIGFMAVDEIAGAYGFKSYSKKFQGELADGDISGVRCLILKPQTYMNLSGQSVGACARFYKIPPEKIIVFHDELDLPFGKIRIKQGGGNGGHNGLKSMDEHVGANYWRVRMGIAHPGDKDRVSDYVLSDFSKAEQKELQPWLANVAKELPLLIAGDAPGMMTRLAQTVSSK